MLQNYFSVRQFRLTKWSFLVNKNVVLRVMFFTYILAMIRLSNCGRLSRMSDKIVHIMDTRCIILYIIHLFSCFQETINIFKRISGGEKRKNTFSEA